MDQFGVSVNQASMDLNRYIGFAPNNMGYDKSARLLPTCTDQHSCAHLRIPMDLIRHSPSGLRSDVKIA